LKNSKSFKLQKQTFIELNLNLIQTPSEKETRIASEYTSERLISGLIIQINRLVLRLVDL